MSRWRPLRRIWGTAPDEAVGAELRYHLERLTESFIAEGLSPDEARRRALLRFGDPSHLAAECETIDRAGNERQEREEWWDALRQDLRFAGRTLWRQRAVAGITVLCLALGIGATTTVFTVANALLLRPLPYPNGERLVLLGVSHTGSTALHGTSIPDFADWRERSRSLTQLTALTHDNFVLLGASPERVRGARVTANLFRAIGARPEAGRFFTADDDVPGAPKVAVVSHGFAARHFGGQAAAAIGRTLPLNGGTHTIVGVVPDQWSLPDGLDLWVPLQPDVAGASRGNRFLQVVGALAPGATFASAETELRAIGRQLAGEHPEDDADYGVVTQPLRERYAGPARPAFLLLGAAALLLLLIACANVGSLQLSRAAARTREIAVRMALGAGRGRLVRQLLTESIVLSLAGGLIGVLLAVEACRAVALAVGRGLPSWVSFVVDWRVLAFTLVVSMIAGIGFGLAPALRLAGLGSPAALRAGTRGGLDRGGSRLHRGLVIAEIAMSVVLLVGAGFAVLSVARLQRIQPGFDPRGVITFRLALLGPEYEEKAPRAAVTREILERLKALPGVTHAGAVTLLPIADCCSQFGFAVEGHPMPPGHDPVATGNLITPGYLAAMRVPLERGRFFTGDDREDAPRVILVSHTFAATHWPGEDPLGRRIHLGSDWWSVVGVVGDIRQTNLIDAPEPQFYMPHAQDPWEDLRFAVRVDRGAPADLVPAIRAAVREVAPAVPVFAVRTMESIMDDSLRQQRLYGALLAGFSLAALALASAGVYGVMSYFVSRRTHEIGVRMALGATRSMVRRQVLGQGAVVAAIGLVAGLAGAVLAARVLAHVLYGIRPGEPLVYLVGAGVLGVTALIATYAPARRASGVDPMEALRAD